MSEGEVAALRREISELSKKSDRQHAENRTSQSQDRETFRVTLQTQQTTFVAAMSAQRDAFQEALNKQFLSHIELDKKVERQAALLKNVAGDGEPGEGRLGVLEAGMETLKKFRWQALTVVALMMWGVEVWRHGH